MTLEEFRAKWRQCKPSMKVEENGYLRSVERGLCPLCELCLRETGLHFANSDYSQAAQKLELSEADVWRVLFTADNAQSNLMYDSALRQELMGDLT